MRASFAASNYSKRITGPKRPLKGPKHVSKSVLPAKMATETQVSPEAQQLLEGFKTVGDVNRRCCILRAHIILAYA